MLKTLVFLLLFTTGMLAQVRTTAIMSHFAGVPTGACVSNQLALNDLTNDLYNCGTDLVYHPLPGGVSANNVFTGTDQFTVGTDLGPVTFANLPVAPADGRVIYCSDCTATTPTAAGGTGNLVVMIGGVWSPASAGATGLGDPASNGIVKRTALNTTAVANVADILALFVGPCTSTNFMRGDGQCQAPPGSGVTSSAGSPGPIAAYFGAAPSTQVQQDANCTTDFSGHLNCVGLSASILSAIGSGANGEILPNAAGGTTSGLVAKIVAGQLVTATTADTAIPVYVIMPTVVNGATSICAAGAAGNACAATTGQVVCTTDAGGSTANDFVVASTATAGRCKDAGATLPTGPICVVGTFATTVAANASATVNVAPGCYGLGTGVADPGANGFMARTGVNTSAARTLTGTANQITITNGTGAAGNPVFSLDTTKVATDTNALTFTTKTLDAEASGNVITRPFYVEFAPGCNNATANPGSFDLPTAAAATSTCFGTTTTHGAMDFVDASTTGVSGHFTLPQGWAGAMDVRLFWFANSASANAVRWSVQTGCVADAAAVSTGPSYNAASASNTAYTGTANQRKTTALTGLAMTNCSGGGQEMYFIAQRIGADAGDTLAATAEVLSIQFEGRATK